MPLHLTSADQGSQKESCFVQVHGEALTLAAHSRQSPRGTSWCVIGLLSLCQKINRTAQSLVNHWPDKDDKRATGQKLCLEH